MPVDGSFAEITRELGRRAEALGLNRPGYHAVRLHVARERVRRAERDAALEVAATVALTRIIALEPAAIARAYDEAVERRLRVRGASVSNRHGRSPGGSMLVAMTCVALIGIGTMGLPMGRNLRAAGHEVIGFDVDPGRAALLGVPCADSAARAAAAAEMTILSLPSVAIVEQVGLDLAGSAARGSLVVDMSTSPPALARRLASAFEAAGAHVLDAPVSGGPRGAEDATLTIMVGGEAAAFERALPVFEALGRLVVHVGAHGAGQAAKLCNNLVAGVTMVAVSETCAVARREGIEPSLLYEILTASTGDSRVLRTRYPLPGADDRHPSNRDFEPMFAVDLIEKDLELAIGLAHEHGVEPDVALQALAAYRRAQQAGLGALDYSAVFRAIDGS